MSDPVKNVEIEDVLSSIRRLVSENGHAPATSKPSAPEVKAVVPEARSKGEAAVESAVDNRLVLTPALRVSDSPEVELVTAPDAVEESSEHAADKALMREIQADIQPLHDSIPNFLQRQIEIEAPAALDSAAPELDAIETHVETSDNEASVDVTEDAVSDTPEPEILEINVAQDFDTRVDAVENDTDAEPQRPWETDGELLSEWHSVRSPAVEDFEPDEPGDSDYAGTAVASLAWEDHSDQTDDLDDVSDDEVAVADESIEEPAAFASISEEALTETVIEGIAQSEDAVEDTQYEAVLDEEMLRDLVGEIVRQELQGPLGERITRNVRKLVRREINRAMTSQSLNNDY